MTCLALIGAASLGLERGVRAGEPVAEVEFFEWFPAFSPSLAGPFLINNNGDFAAKFQDGRVVVWIEGVFNSPAIPSCAGLYVVGPLGINDDGLVVGAASCDAVEEFFFTGFHIEPFGSFELGAPITEYWGVNNAGAIVGSLLPVSENGGIARGFRIDSGVVTLLDFNFRPAGISDNGWIYGTSTFAQDGFYAKQGGGPVVHLGAFGGNNHRINRVSKAGGFAGRVGFPGSTTQAFAYFNGVGRVIPNVPGATQGEAYAVTLDGKVIGRDANAPGFDVQHWVLDGDQRIFMPDLLEPFLGFRPMIFLVAAASEEGWILGLGREPVSNTNRIFRCKIRVAPPPDLDTDGDGLLDDWEENGIPYTDSKGAEQRYMLPNANPLRKDLYIEVDGGTFPLNDQSIARVVFAFDQAPVANSDNSTGIRLHVVKDEFDLLLPNSVVVARRRFPENYTVIKGERFGTMEERQGPDAAARLAAKAKAFRYCLAYDGIEFQNGVDAYSGLGRTPGADFVINLGLPALRDGVRDIDEVAGVFMHELGHNLGLDHGGGDTVHGKPNYVSVMNYAWTMPKPFSVRFWRLDYSREALATLQENDLSESAGINSMLYRGVSMPFGVGPELIRSMRLVKLSGRPTDFDGSGGPPSGIVDADLNFIGPGAGIPGTGSPSPSQPLTGHNDWPARIYAINPNQIISARGDLDDGFPDGCPTAESIEFLSKNVPEPCYADIDGDNFIGFADLNAVISRFNAAQGEPLYDAAADIDADGLIGFADLNEILSRFNDPCP